MTERVLSLDISTKTGWALLVSGPSEVELEAYGQIPQIPEPNAPYPGNYVDWAYMCFGEIVKLIDTYCPDVLVIEETSKGRANSFSQKILEFAHFLVAKLVKETGIRAVYVMSGQWRTETECKMTKTEKDLNKYVREYKKKNKTKIAYDKSGKRIGEIGKKHVNIRRANEIFGQFLSRPLLRKDEDTADALMLAYCYHVRKLKRGKV